MSASPYSIEDPNYARPQWTHKEPSIQCRADWKGAVVFVFKNQHQHRKSRPCFRILAYTKARALEVLREIEEEEKATALRLKEEDDLEEEQLRRDEQDEVQE